MESKKIVKQLNALIDHDAGHQIRNIVERMRIYPKRNQTSYRDELSALINNYEMSNVEIGVFSFFDGYKVVEKYLLFGKIEMDLLAVDRSTREIVLLDHDNIDHVMIKCSKSSSDFLEILYVYSEFTVNRLLDNDTYVLPEKKVLNEISGGDAYGKFVDFLFDF